MLQRAIWEAEFQTFERQQRLAQQQRYRSGQSRFNLTRHISMPTINKFCDVQAGCARSEQSSQCQTQRLQPDASTATASATDGGTGLSPGRSCANPVQHQLPVPYIRVPCNNIEVPASGLLPEVPSLAGLVSKSLLRNSKSSSSSNPYRSPYTRSNSTGSTKSAKRRVSDLGNAVPKAYQPVLGLAAKAKAASQSASALSRAAVSPEQQQAVAAARVKAGVIERSMGSTLNHSTSVATCSAGLGAQASSSRTSKESNKLALVK